MEITFTKAIYVYLAILHRAAMAQAIAFWLFYSLA
jgi:hypothetical protein